ncbi:MAG: preprotein translocase subunit SecA [Acidimicrobiia bacterium]
MALLKKLLSAGEGKKRKGLEAVVDRVKDLETEIQPLSDDQLAAKTQEFKRRLADGETLEDIEPEAYAVVREAARRVLRERPYDVQVLGAAVLHRHSIAEMKTGEGKTLVSTMPVYLNALTGRGVHVVTVNDYLARRDAEWMGGVHRSLGLSVGLIQSGQHPDERRPQYQSDITYGTNNEFGFDYLRDNMSMDPAQMVQRGHYFAIVDEVDSILIDEARTPLIISGTVGETAKWYRDFSRIANRLKPELHYTVDEAKRQVITTEAGVTQVEQFLGVENLYDHVNVDFIHHLDVALRARALYHRDVDYVVANGEIKIVDEFTGRILEGRRYSEGIHQAIEAKEGVRIKEENQTLATITLQNYFRLYEKLGGMTGTAATEAAEFSEIYRLDVVDVPTNMPVARADEADLIYMTEDSKFNALTEDIVERHAAGQPILIGTVSIEKSERLSNVLRKRGIDHEVLNAKNHEREAAIIAQAGRIGAVTVATNMAGRGVDIKLGGNPDEMARMELRKRGIESSDDAFEDAFAKEVSRFAAERKAEHDKVIELGGLYVLGTERHESRRIDNQLRGRSGRQGDPGESRFYLSLEDDLMRRFAWERIQAVMRRFKLPEDVPIEHNMVTKAIERAQRQVESQNFEIRKNVLKYDEVMNMQRSVIYEWRQRVLMGDDIESLIRGWLDEAVEGAVGEIISDEVAPREWDMELLHQRVTQVIPFSESPESLVGDADGVASVAERIAEMGQDLYTKRAEKFGPEKVRVMERQVVLQLVDTKWREHLAEMDYLRSGVGLRAMGQRDPLVEYQREGYDMFAAMVDSIKEDSVRVIMHAEPVTEQRRVREPGVKLGPVPAGGTAPQPGQSVSTGDKVGRNDPCPCGSGKKYKKCHGAVA